MLESQVFGGTFNPKYDREKVDFVAKYAVEEGGAQDPAAMAAFILNMVPMASQSFPTFKPLDAVFRHIKASQGKLYLEEAFS